MKQFLKAVSPSITLKSDPTDTLFLYLLQEQYLSEAVEGVRRIVEDVHHHMPLASVKAIGDLLLLLPGRAHFSLHTFVADGEYRFNSIPVVRKYELGSAQTITRNKRMLTERDFDLLEGRSFWYNAYNLTLMDFRSRISFCVDNRSEIRDSRAIENTKCQNDKIIFIFCRYQP